MKTTIMVTTITTKRLNELGCILGLDCSRYQKDINWAQAKAAGIDFAFIKITEGTTGHEDNLYNLKARVLDALKNNIKIGFYHFARPGDFDNPEQDSINEVGNVLSHIGFLPKVTLPLVLDVEAYSTELILWQNVEKVDHMNKFITTFIHKLNEANIRVILYSYKSFLDINTMPIFGLQPLWIASYLNTPETSLPPIPLGWNEWKIWQFTEKGQIGGYIGDIDLNIMKKDYYNLF
jgi:GH25 family lysozyme M1 (1,4-beta-N-acetylmuramidase)